MDKNRIIGLDILRIISMFGIVGLHVINRGGLIYNANIYTVKYYIILILLIIFYTSVDVFGILSGYLNIYKDTNKHSRIIELISIVVYYCLTIPTIYYIININKIVISKELVFNYIPILDGKYWYIISYVFVFFLIPYINKFCKMLDRYTYKKFLILVLVLLSIIPNLLFENDIFRILYGYSPFWLIYCYMIGAYIKIYNIKIDTKKNLKYLLIIFLSTFMINVGIRNIGYILFNRVVKGEFLIDYISPFTVILSIMLLLLFMNINIKNNKVYNIIKYFSQMSFAVYIVHCHRIIYEYYFGNLFVPLLKYNSIVVFSGIILSIILIYIICCIVDEIRKIIFKILRINKLNEFIGNKFDNLLN